MELTLLFCQLVLFLIIDFKGGESKTQVKARPSYFVPTWVSGEVLNVQDFESVQTTVLYDEQIEQTLKPKIKIRKKRKRHRVKKKRNKQENDSPEKDNRRKGKKATDTRRSMVLKPKKKEEDVRSPIDIIVHFKMMES